MVLKIHVGSYIFKRISSEYTILVFNIINNYHHRVKIIYLYHRAIGSSVQVECDDLNSAVST